MVSYGFRQAFEQARRDVSCVFAKTTGVDIEKIKESKFFRAFINNSKANVANSLVWMPLVILFIVVFISAD